MSYGIRDAFSSVASTRRQWKGSTQNNTYQSAQLRVQHTKMSRDRERLEDESCKKRESKYTNYVFQGTCPRTKHWLVIKRSGIANEIEDGQDVNASVLLDVFLVLNRIERSTEGMKVYNVQ